MNTSTTSRQGLRGFSEMLSGDVFADDFQRFLKSLEPVNKKTNIYRDLEATVYTPMLRTWCMSDLLVTDALRIITLCMIPTRCSLLESFF